MVVDDVDPSTTLTILREIIRTELSGLDIARGVANKVCEKHHHVLGDELLCLDYASSRIDLAAALESARVALSEQ